MNFRDLIVFHCLLPFVVLVHLLPGPLIDFVRLVLLGDSIFLPRWVLLNWLLDIVVVGLLADWDLVSIPVSGD